MTSKYEQGTIYKICDSAYTKCYYGSTIEPLCKRIARHRSMYRKFKSEGGHKVTVYTLFDEFGIDSCKIELVELFPCASKMELEKKEGEYIRTNECVNKMIMGRTMKEYMKEYREKNKEQISKQFKESYDTHKDRIHAKHKEWLEKHADQVQDTAKRYYIANKERIQSRHVESYTCDICGGKYPHRSKSTHFHTKLHQNALSASSTEPDEEVQLVDDNTNDN